MEAQKKSALDTKVISSFLVWLCRLLTGIRARQTAPIDKKVPCIYYANHSSHLDGVVIWSCLHPSALQTTHPVAAEDYWNKTRLRRYLSRRIFGAVLIPRLPNAKEGAKEATPQSTQEAAQNDKRQNALELMQATLDKEESLIIFPEGTRGDGEAIAPFKSGLWHLSLQNPQAQLVPVYLENLNRVLPKGSRLVVPIICSATFGPPIDCASAQENKQDFLARAKSALEELHHDPH